MCNHRLTEQRQQRLSLWAASIKQPKHLVLTMRNFEILTRKKIRQFQIAFLKLRRQQIFKDVNGGTCSLELTHEGRGWHLHAHCLIDCRWLDISQLAIVWGQLLGQEFGIVKIKDARDKDYLREVFKYVVKGSDLASWPPDLILQLVTAVRGVRLFTTFGSLNEQRDRIKAQLAFIKREKKKCACGSLDFIFESDVASILREHRK
jgi:hypothetical protein